MEACLFITRLRKDSSSRDVLAHINLGVDLGVSQQLMTKFDSYMHLLKCVCVPMNHKYKVKNGKKIDQKQSQYGIFFCKYKILDHYDAKVVVY